MNSLPLVTIVEKSHAAGPQIREMLHVRTCELALRAGRILPHVAQLDYEQAKRELTGEAERDQQDAAIAAMEARVASGEAPPVATSSWTEAELDESILTLCDELPSARMAACSRAVEHCRRWTPRGTPESLLGAMREVLRRDMESQRNLLRPAA
ncbi:MAG TPA: hypothetical protein VHD62_08460 [Opitutaceae bacterium]|nr:hypothetical protein [Opitutaceae bacterium]